MSEFQSELDESCFLDSGSTKSLTVNEFKTSNSLKGLKLCSQNIRSVYKNLDALLLVLFSVSVVVDIFCLSETWHNKDNIPTIPGYHKLHGSSETNQCSGVITYVRNELNVRYYKFQFDFDVPGVDVLLVEVPSIGNGIIIANFYRSPSGNLSQFLVKWEMFLNKVMENNVTMWIVGDFNIDISNHEMAAVSRFKIITHGAGFRFLESGPSHITEGKDTKLDFMITNSLANSVCYSVNACVTDHCMIIGSLDLVVVRDASVVPPRIDFDAVIRDLLCLDFNYLYNYGTVNDTLLELTRVIQDCLDHHSCAKIKESRYSSPRQPWMTRGLLTSLKKKLRMWKKFKKFKGNNMLKENFLNYKRLLNKLIEQAKSSYYVRILKNVERSSKNKWAVINTLVHSRKTSKDYNLSDDLVMEDGTKISDPVSIANFAINSLVKSKVHDDINVHLATLNVKPSTATAFLYPVSDGEICSIIGNKIKMKTSSGPDKIPASIIKKLPNLIPVLTSLCNRMISDGEFPKCLKDGRVIFIHKKDSKSNISNYRPITVLNTFSKIFESVIANRIADFLKKFRPLHEHQYAFKPRIGTEDALLKLVSTLQTELSNGSLVLAMSLDIAKAFDSVSHVLLIKKMERMGFRGLFSSLLTSYLQNRNLYTCVKNVQSANVIMKEGLPQGSVLGPLLFSIFLDDLFSLSVPGRILGYADDNLVSMVCNRFETDILCFQSWIDGLAEWYKYNGFRLNTEKCEFIIFGSSYRLRVIDYSSKFVVLGDSKIYASNNINYLGININRCLNWSPHVENIINKVAFYLPLMYQLRKILRKDILFLILKVVLLPKMLYGLICYGNTFKSTLRPLSIFINKVIRTICFMRYDSSVKSVLVDVKILNIEQRYFSALIKYIIKVKMGGYNASGLEFCQGHNYDVYDLRHNRKNLVRVKRVRNRYDLHHINNRMFKLCNLMASLDYPILQESLELFRPLWDHDSIILKLDIDVIWLGL